MQHSLKIEVEGLKNQTQELSQALEEKSADLDKSEAAFRSEVSFVQNNHEADCKEQEVCKTSEAVQGGSEPPSLSTCTTTTTTSKHKMPGLVRYRSLRDHNGRYYLVVKIA